MVPKVAKRAQYMQHGISEITLAYEFGGNRVFFNGYRPQALR